MEKVLERLLEISTKLFKKESGFMATIRKCIIFLLGMFGGEIGKIIDSVYKLGNEAVAKVEMLVINITEWVNNGLGIDIDYFITDNNANFEKFIITDCMKQDINELVHRIQSINILEQEAKKIENSEEILKILKELEKQKKLKSLAKYNLAFELLKNYLNDNKIHYTTQVLDAVISMAVIKLFPKIK